MHGSPLEIDGDDVIRKHIGTHQAVVVHDVLLAFGGLEHASLEFDSRDGTGIRDSQERVSQPFVTDTAYLRRAHMIQAGLIDGGLRQQHSAGAAVEHECEFLSAFNRKLNSEAGDAWTVMQNHQRDGCLLPRTIQLKRFSLI